MDKSHWIAWGISLFVWVIITIVAIFVGDPAFTLLGLIPACFAGGVGLHAMRKNKRKDTP